MKFKKLIFITLFFLVWFFFNISNVNAITYPNFLHSSIGNNGIHPTGDFTLDITYEDVSVGIDTSTDDLKLYKYDGNSWGNDIASTYIDLAGKTIGKNHSIYSVSGLDFGKYKYIFSIKNIDGNLNLYEIIFYVDRPSYNIKLAEHDIGKLEINTKKISTDFQNVNVKTIGAPYVIKMIRLNDMTYDLDLIPVWNGTEGWGYSKEPYATSSWFSAINNITLNNSPLKNNTSGNLNNDSFIFKVGAMYDDELQSAGEYKANLKFDINFTYCPEYNLDNTCKQYGKKIKTISGAKKWEDGTIAKTCYFYKYPEYSGYDYLGEIGDGTYWIQPDSAQSAFKAYCDMTSNGGGWTRYVNIKGDYTFQNSIDCWLGTNISNSNLECFNPNRYGVNSIQLFNDEWNGEKFYYQLNDSNPSLSTASESGSRKCLGHNEYMTIMRADQTPQSDGSDTAYVRMGKDFCSFGRDPAGRSGGNYMNYDPSAVFGEDSGAAREGNAKFSKIYFREKDLGFTQIDKTIVNYNGAKRWSDETYAKSCNEYKNPPIGYSYTGDTGDGEYFIDSDGTGGNSEFKVLCDMTTDNGGWTRILKWESGQSDIYANGLIIGGNKILMTYKRKDDTSKKYAIRIDKFKLKQCGEEYFDIGSYVNHIQTGSWGSCGRVSTTGDYNDIRTTELVENGFIEDTCVSGNNHKATSRNTSWWVSGGKGHIQYRVSNDTVLMGPHGNASSRCASHVDNNRRQTQVETWVR